MNLLLERPCSTFPIVRPLNKFRNSLTKTLCTTFHRNYIPKKKVLTEFLHSRSTQPRTAESTQTNEGSGTEYAHVKVFGGRPNSGGKKGEKSESIRLSHVLNCVRKACTHSRVPPVRSTGVRFFVLAISAECQHRGGRTAEKRVKRWRWWSG